MIKPTLRFLALPCLTLLGGFLTVSNLSAQDAKPKAKASEKAPAKEKEADAEEGPTAEEFILANIAVLDNMEASAVLLDSVKDVKSAKIAAAKLKKQSAELKVLFGELHELGEPTGEEREKLEKETKLPARGEKVAKHFKAATDALGELEDKEALVTISPALQEYGNIAKNGGKEAEPEEETEPAGNKTPATLEDAMKLSSAILDNMDGASEILESITDADTAKDAVPELDKATAELKAIVKKAKAMGDLSPADKKKMDTNEKLAARGEKISERFQKAATGLKDLDDKSAAATIAPSLMKYGMAAQALNEKK